MVYVVDERGLLIAHPDIGIVLRKTDLSRLPHVALALGKLRDPSIDVQAWVQSIPFTETRIYVQRVMQNLQDYRDRLNTQQSDRCAGTAFNSRAS